MERETAMKILKELHGKSLFAERTALETLIPELKESGDEKIRKAIIGTLPKYGYLPQTTIKVEDALTWLEKQGKQKPTSDIRYEVNAGGSLSVVNGKPFDYEKATITQKDFAPQQEWSEEDENMANDLIEGFLSSVSPYQLTHTCQEIADWLKSLKDRVRGKEEKK